MAQPDEGSKKPLENEAVASEQLRFTTRSDGSTKVTKYCIVLTDRFEITERWNTLEVVLLPWGEDREGSDDDLPYETLWGDPE